MQTIKSFMLILLTTYCANANAQSVSNLVNAKVDSNDAASNSMKPVQNAGIQSPFYGVEDSIIENRLVQLALAQPNYEQTLYQQKIFEYQLKKQRNAWMNLLTLSANFNDQTFATPSTATGAPIYVYPKFFFGINIPLGMIASNGTDVKITKQSELIAKSQQAELAKSIKSSVLTSYTEYKANEKLIALQNQVVDDEQANLLKTEQKFRTGTATLEEYNLASRLYNSEMVKAINLQLQQDILKIEIERLIGRKLEDLFK